jgi:hypothetical protein
LRYEDQATAPETMTTPTVVTVAITVIRRVVRDRPNIQASVADNPGA